MATTIGTALVEILPDTSSFGPTLERDIASATKGATNELGKVEDSFDDLGTAAGVSSDKISSSFGGDLLKSGALVAGAGAVVGALGSMASASIDAASDLGESINAVNVVFGDAADSVIAFGEDSAEAVGLSQRAFNEAVVPIGALLNNMGLDAEAAADSTLELAERAADMASVFNVDVTQALGAIGSGLRGETEPLRAFGVNVSEAAINAKALELGLIDVGEAVDPTAKAIAATEVILEQTNAVAGDFAETSDGLANSQRILAARMEDAQAAAGEALLPAMEALVGVASGALDLFLALPDPLQTTVVLVTGLGVAALASVVGVSALVRSLGTLGLTGAATSLTTALGSTAAFLTGPWGLAIAGAAAVIGAFVLNTDDAEEATRAWEDALADAEGSASSAADAIVREFLNANRDAATELEGLGLTVDDLVAALTLEEGGLLKVSNALLGITDPTVDLTASLLGLSFATDTESNALRDLLLDTLEAQGGAEAFAATADAIGLSTEAAATGTEALVVATQGVNPAAIDAAGGVSYFDEAVGPAEQSTRLLGDQLVRLHDEYLKLVDPTFAAIDAANAVTQAQRRYDKVFEDHPAKSKAATDAALDLASANLESDAALLRLAEVGGPAAIDVFREMRDDGQITGETFRTLRDRVNEVEGAADDAATEIEGDLRPALEGVDRPYNPELSLTGGPEAQEQLDIINDRLEGFVSRVWPIDIVVDVSGDTGGLNLVPLDSGGMFNRGDLIYSGVPELFVAPFSGSAVPLTAGQVDRLISSLAVGVSTDPGVASSVTVNVAPGAIVIDRPSSSADVAVGVTRALQDLARTRLSRDGH